MPEAEDLDNPEQRRSTREAWLALAVETLVREGIDRVKVQVMAKQLKVSRSSFYWFFPTQQDLTRAMLDHWLSRNTGPILHRAARPAATICAAILNVAECWMNEDLFDPRLDMAVRLWGRRDEEVLKVVTEADTQRLDALTRMFQRYGYGAKEAMVRARVIYFTQIGHYTLDIQEDTATRLSNNLYYLRSFTGQEPTAEELERFDALWLAMKPRD